jgi:hypothetical protein
MALRISLEVGSKRVFASALDWPGWCRSAKDEDLAIEALLDYAPRYALIAKEAGRPFDSRSGQATTVIERVAGGATTDFGAPEKVVKAELEPLTKKQAESIADLVQATWRVFDRVVAGAPARLRKGPRGGGRDRDAIADHVVSAEVVYARKLGIRSPVSGYADNKALRALRSGIEEVFRSARDPGPLVAKGWPVRYAARRIAWHATDHAWEIEDKSE